MSSVVLQAPGQTMPEGFAPIGGSFGGQLFGPLGRRPTVEDLQKIDRGRFRTLLIFRSVLAVVLTLFLDEIVSFGLSPAWLCVAAVSGILVAGFLVGRGIPPWKWLLGHAVAVSFVQGALYGMNLWVLSQSDQAPERDFLVSLLSDRVLVVGLFYFAGLLSTWLFWTVQTAVTIEGLIYAVLLVWFLGGHRNYQLDAPKQLSSLTWKVDIFQRWQIEPQHLILAVALVSTAVLVIYLVLAHQRPLFRAHRVVKASFARRSPLTYLTPIALLFVLLSYAWWLNQRYSAGLDRAAEGVGQGAKPGESNLGFHSAVGATRQPTALVRLEGDYKSNPWAPMLYLREGALSQFDGKQLVNAPPTFDTDVPRVKPGDSFSTIVEDTYPELRSEVVQSIYVLTKHTSPFAIDYPTRIAPIKNPDPNRFTMAYQAISNAPVVKIEDVIGRPVGNPHWDEATRAHYLRSPGSLTQPTEEISLEGDAPVLDGNGEDLRYRALMERLVGGETDDVSKAALIVRYLSENSTYTRAPGHQVSERGDPVAPYLFSKEMRGYCVHFAHAAVYMMRLAGIPARIATGYLTDLKYAKDGHILLHMGDRHAWPEVYVEGLGWTVFDVTPAKAENEQAIVPDPKLLEELMSKLDPAEQLLAPPPAEDRPGDADQKGLSDVFHPWMFYTALLVFAFGWVAFKTALRFGYKLASSPARRTALAYLSFASYMADLGITRHRAETRREYANRVLARFSINAHGLTALHEYIKYCPSPGSIQNEQVGRAFSEFASSVGKAHGFLRRWLGFLSPLSLFQLRQL